MKNGLLIGFQIILSLLISIMLFSDNIVSFGLSFLLLSVAQIFDRDKNFLSLKISWKQQTFLIFCSILFAITFFPNNLFMVNYGIGLFVLLILLIYGYLLVKKLYIFSEKKKSEGSKLPISLYFFLFLAISTLYLLAFDPGIFVADSINQWQQIHSDFPWNDWHPVMHTFFIKIFSFGSSSPIGFVFFQIIVYSLVMSYMFNFIQDYLKVGMISIFLVFFLVFPVFPMMSIMIIKDSLFTYFLILVTINLLKVVLTKGKWLQSNLNSFFMFISLLGFVFFRHNGWPVFLVFVILFMILFRMKGLRFFIISLLVIATYLVVTGPIYTRNNVIKSDPTESLGMFVQISAAVIKNGEPLSENQEKYYSQIMSIENWKNLYNPRDVDKIKFKERFNKNVIKDDSKAFILNTVKLALKNPIVALKAYFLQTEVLWHSNMKVENLRPIFRYPLLGKQGPFYFLSKEQIEKYSPQYESVMVKREKFHNPFLENMLVSFTQHIVDKKIFKLFMPALFFLMFIVGIGFLITKKQFDLLLSFMPYLLTMGTMFVAIPAQDIRYAFPNYFIGVIAIALGINVQSKKEKE
ncbi:DUF6020 family protein [Enterococcus dispar]|uniref:DUF6020 family protein n=1 Tax=Enterococcus dispar TaxID=44009 RepID=UPI00189EAA07|nr:DUF6020 family protein [Enterococcus dispar]MCU7356353.1 DUF6020 family protein [Enterococcus dispar]WCG33642.1 DUF6020 family protein [Enterococcus dispar]